MTKQGKSMMKIRWKQITGNGQPLSTPEDHLLFRREVGPFKHSNYFNRVYFDFEIFEIL